jgi:hypothetical protein
MYAVAGTVPAKQIRLAGTDPQSRDRRTFAVGKDDQGKLWAGSSNGFDKGQKAMCVQLGIETVPTRYDKHAEENLLAHWWLEQHLKVVGTSKLDPCGPEWHDCEGQLLQKRVIIDNLPGAG